MSIIQSAKLYYEQYPLRTILLAALVMRLLAAFFSEGYAFHDDHFCVTRVADSWINGIPHWIDAKLPPKHSMFYAGANAAILYVFDVFDLQDPYVKTTILRIAHALYSLLIVLFGYKIVKILDGEKSANLTGWILALLWFMPFMSVRFLVEMVCIPPVLAGFYLLIRQHKAEVRSIWTWVLAGALFAVAFAIRYHTILFAGGLGLVLLFRKEWAGSIFFSLGFLTAAFLVIGVVDWVFFDYPFHSITEYYRFNSENANNFVTGSPFKFTLTTFGFLLPPVSIFLMIGFVRAWKVEPMMFVAGLIFFVFHSSFPNQQERFIMPVFPLIIILGVIGWGRITAGSDRLQMLRSISWKFFWTLNIIAGLFMAFTFAKKDRVEPLHYLSEKDDVRSVIIENERSVKQPPAFYLGENSSDYDEWEEDELGLMSFVDNKSYRDPNYKIIFRHDSKRALEELQQALIFTGKQPNYIIFKGTKDMETRQRDLMTLFPSKQLVFETEIKPSMFDQMLHFFNPRVHRDQTAFIYKID